MVQIPNVFQNFNPLIFNSELQPVKLCLSPGYIFEMVPDTTFVFYLCFINFIISEISCLKVHVRLNPYWDDWACLFLCVFV